MDVDAFLSMDFYDRR
jgi:hypothetical protein